MPATLAGPRQVSLRCGTGILIQWIQIRRPPFMYWLTTPGNYKRWQTEKKRPLCEEIVAYLEMEGITHRDADQVWTKIVLLQKQVEAATNWPIAYEHYGSFQ
ncbi:hypothetical protein PI125_g17523 [Phytophthora idaei]|nr:hypothetical protein PI125_g17523 [Phytophthora idaei]